MNKKEKRKIKSVINTILSTIVIGLLIGTCIYGTEKANSKTYVEGTIVGKYRNGINDQTYHFVISAKKTHKKIDVVSTKAQYESYSIQDYVYIDYNLLKEIKYMESREEK